MIPKSINKRIKIKLKNQSDLGRQQVWQNLSMERLMLEKVLWIAECPVRFTTKGSPQCIKQTKKNSFGRQVITHARGLKALRIYQVIYLFIYIFGLLWFYDFWRMGSNTQNMFIVPNTWNIFFRSKTWMDASDSPVLCFAFSGGWNRHESVIFV